MPVSRDQAPSDLDEALLAPLALRLGEADVAILAEQLVGKSRGERFQQAPPLPTPSTTLRLAVARVLATGCLRFLLQSGGGRARSVLRNGRRQRGRLWDPALNAGFDATFSALPLTLLWDLATVVLPLAERRQETLQRSVLAELTREERRALVRALPKPMTSTAAPKTAATTATATTTHLLDHVFVVLALEHRNSLRLPDVVEEVVRQALIGCSPLAALFYADEAVPDGGGTGGGKGADDAHIGAGIAALCAPGPVRLLEVCDGALGDALLKRLRLVWSRSADGADFTRRCARFAGRVRSLVDGLEQNRRLDLLGPVARLVAALPDELPGDARARLVRLPGVTTMSDRDGVVTALNGIVDLALVLDDVRARMQAERYGDDRYEEAQLTLAVLDDVLKPRRDAVTAFARALSGAVG